MGTRVGIYCVNHKEPTHVDVKSKKCQSIGCRKQPTYGPMGTLVGIYCVNHKEPTHVDVKSKKCQSIGCDKQPYYGPVGTRVGIYCVNHKEPTHVDVKNKKCQSIGCDKQPYYGPVDTRVGIYCVNHKEPTHVDVKHKKCQSIGCRKQPYYGPVGTRVGIYCVNHKEPTHVDVKNKKCQSIGCDKLATYGHLFQPQTRCARHKTENQYMKNNPKCQVSRCKNQPTHTDQQNNYPLRCEDHTNQNDKDVVQRKCNGCGLMWFIRQGLELCNDCHAYAQPKIRHAKELEIKALLESCGFKFQYDQVIDSSCTRQRPDFVIEFVTINSQLLIIIVEVDENQHRSYSCLCEQARMIMLFQTFGGTQVIFVRYNPDSFKNNEGKAGRVGAKKRQDRLIQVIKSVQLHPPKDLLSVIHLWFDGDNGQNAITKIDYEKHFLEQSAIAA